MTPLVRPLHEWLTVDGSDDAVKQVLDLLRSRDGSADDKTEAFFFGGWFRVGASAVIRAVAKHLKSRSNDSDTRKHFGKIIHVDCSLWKSRRAMQRAIAEELNLHHLMHMFDKRDEEDDFRGVDDSSRTVILSIAKVINRSLRDEKFLMVFHYGGDEDIDLTEFGIPGVVGEGKLLWTTLGRFQLSRIQPKLKFGSTHGFISLNCSLRSFKVEKELLYKEAAEVIGYIGMDGTNPAIVVDCVLYSLFLTEQQSGKYIIGVDYGWATHACNYWICDGILQGDIAWKIGNVLYGVISPVGSYHSNVAYFLGEHGRPYGRWYSITSEKQAAQSISTIPINASSYFLTFEGDGQTEELRNDLFQLASNLRVLKLCNCGFDFSSPPFRCCHNLRFLWLDHCTNTGEEQGEGTCFLDLLILDLRCTDYVLLPHMIGLMTNLRELNAKGVSWRTISQAWKKLQSLHKLRLTESSDVITVDNCSAVDMMNLELLDFSGNIHLESLPEMSSTRSLKMLILDGCSSLKHVAFKRALPLLESFSFDGYGPAENWTHHIQLPRKELRPKSRVDRLKEAKMTKISLEGCARLHSIFLRALSNLEELDLSGTAMKTIDLSEMDVPRLKKLFLLGCEQLHSLFWNVKEFSLEVLHVDTNRGKMRSGVCCGEQKSVGFEACICFTDARFLSSAINGFYSLISSRKFQHGFKVHIHISSTIHSQVDITKSIHEIGPSQEPPPLPYNAIVLAKDVTCSSLVWDHQRLHPLGCHIEIGEGSHDLENILPDFSYSKEVFMQYVQSMHVHDNNSLVTAMGESIVGTYLNKLQWCHVERCPRLQAVSTCGQHFPSLRTLSACDLSMAYCIFAGRFAWFGALHHIYLHNCPRLVFVAIHIIPCLATLQIAYCSNLQHVFPSDDRHSEERASGVTFNKLKHIKLFHLHRLEQICEVRLTAPALETISLRDCWGMRRLPAVGSKLPMVDCEKDWWERLEWDGLEANHDPLLFQTRHSAYYKRTLPRVSVLR